MELQERVELINSLDTWVQGAYEYATPDEIRQLLLDAIGDLPSEEDGR